MHGYPSYPHAPWALATVLRSSVLGGDSRFLRKASLGYIVVQYSDIIRGKGDL